MQICGNVTARRYKGSTHITFFLSISFSLLLLIVRTYVSYTTTWRNERILFIVLHISIGIIIKTLTLQNNVLFQIMHFTSQLEFLSFLSFLSPPPTTPNVENGLKMQHFFCDNSFKVQSTFSLMHHLKHLHLDEITPMLYCSTLSHIVADKVGKCWVKGVELDTLARSQWHHHNR